MCYIIPSKSFHPEAGHEQYSPWHHFGRCLRPCRDCTHDQDVLRGHTGCNHERLALLAVGFLIPNSLPGIDPIIRGLLLGIVLSLPDAIITKAYAPIMGLGIVGGTVVGIITRLVGAG